MLYKMLEFWHERFGLPLKNDELLEKLYTHKERLNLDYYENKFNFSWLCSCVAEMDSYKYLFKKESSEHNHYYMYSWMINDALICGKDPRISGRQQIMLEEEGIDYINVFNLIS